MHMKFERPSPEKIESNFYEGSSTEELQDRIAAFSVRIYELKSMQSEEDSPERQASLLEEITALEEDLNMMQNELNQRRGAAFFDTSSQRAGSNDDTFEIAA